MPEFDEVPKKEPQDPNKDINLFDLINNKGEKIIPPHNIFPQKEEILPQTRHEAQIPISIQKSETPSAPIQKPITPLPIPITASKERIPIQEQPKIAKKLIWKILKYILVIMGCFLFVFLFLNFPALWKKINYSYKEQTGQKPQVQKIVPSSVSDDLLFLSTVTLYKTPTKEEIIKAGEVKQPTKDELGLSGLENNQLWIPKIDVRVPIIWDSSVEENTMLDNLKNGVVHYQGTAKPGEKSQDGEGNVFISGHSSYYWWSDGQYKTIFANLNELQNGDEIAIGYGDYGYVYKVFDKQIVNPEEISVLKQDTDKPILSLMTCYPVGTDAKRLVVKAELVGRASDKPGEEPKPQPKPSPLPTKLQSNDIIYLLPWLR